MKRIIPVIMLLAVALQLNGTLFSYMLFKINQRDIAATVCIHRMPQCHGKCYLEKNLAKENNAPNRHAAKIEFADVRIEATVPSSFRGVLPEQTANFPFAGEFELLSGHPHLLKQPPRLV